MMIGDRRLTKHFKDWHYGTQTSLDSIQDIFKISSGRLVRFLFDIGCHHFYHQLFYRKYHQSLDVYWHDKTNKIIKVIERSDITIYTTSVEPHNLPYRFRAEFPSQMDLRYTIETLKIDGIDRASETTEQCQTDNNITKKEITYQLQLTGKKEYRYFRKMTRLISLEHEPFIVLSSSWHTYRPRVTINCHDRDIKAYFTSTGTLDNFVTIDGQNNSEYMEEQYPALMMKAQGYFIYFAANQIVC